MTRPSMLRAAPVVCTSSSRCAKAFLVGIEDGDQRAFGNVEALAQQVDATSASKAPAADRG
jgi:hypothetical protein